MISLEEIDTASFPDQKSPTLKRINAETLTKIIDSFKNTDKLVIVDCRSDSEFNEGHIKGALNYYPGFADYQELYDSNYSEDRLFVFHCEFSQFRGPKGITQFKQVHNASLNKDRPLQAYILHGGYSNFWEEFRSYCDGDYKPETF